jgi:hypothetical protein
MDEDDVERPAEAQRAHVPLEVLALGIERSREREHVWRHVAQRALEARLQMRRVVAAARAQLEQ